MLSSAELEILVVISLLLLPLCPLKQYPMGPTVPLFNRQGPQPSRPDEIPHNHSSRDCPSFVNSTVLAGFHGGTLWAARISQSGR